jgi:hypothetical protein
MGQLERNADRIIKIVRIKVLCRISTNKSIKGT